MTLEAFLQQHGIAFTPYAHPAVFTVAEAAVHCAHVPGMDCKNLFLRDKVSERFFLVTLPAEKRLDMKALAKTLGIKELRFGSEVELWQVFQIKPGAVSPLGLINDTQKQVTYIIDQEVWDVDERSFHPNRNTESWVFPRDAFHALVTALEHPYKLINL